MVHGNSIAVGEMMGITEYFIQTVVSLGRSTRSPPRLGKADFRSTRGFWNLRLNLRLTVYLLRFKCCIYGSDERKAPSAGLSKAEAPFIN